MQRRVKLAIIVMGISGLVAEIILLRELLTVFSGNELSIGIIFANWLILEACGSFFLGRLAEKSRRRLETFTGLSLLFSLAFLAAIVATRLLKRALGVSLGEPLGLFPMSYTSFLILLPVSVLHGALFTLSCRIYAETAAQDPATAGKVYVYETLGTLIGGIVSTYLLIPHLNAIEAALWIALLNFAVGLGLLAARWRRGRLPQALVIVLVALLGLSSYSLFSGQAERWHQAVIAAQWRPLNVVHYQNSHYGNLCVVENEGQYIFFQDGLPILFIPAPDMIAVEEFVHLPLLAHPAPANVLILSGGAGGVIHEVLKHSPIETVTYAELDPLLLTLIRQFPTPLTESELQDARVQVRHMDGRLWLATTPHTYDLIWVGMLEPGSLQTNRFFTREFFALADQRLHEDGILVLGLPGSLTFLHEALQNLNSTIYYTLRSVFPYVRVIPGDGRNLLLASRSEAVLAVDQARIIERLSARNITTDGLVPWHIENKLHPGWQMWFAQFIEGRAQRINADFRPLGVFYSIAHWNVVFAPGFGRIFNHFERINVGLVALLIALGLGLYFLYRHRRSARASDGVPVGIPFAIITTGFAGMLFDLVSIFAFQALYGYVFAWIGLLVAAFMAGAAAGALLITRVMAEARDQRRLLLRLEVSIIVLALGLPVILHALHTFVGAQIAFTLSRTLFLGIPLLCGLAVGAQFPLANQLYLQAPASLSQTAGLLYAADLLGGWLGGIVGGVVLLPVLGLGGTCLTIALLKLASFLVVYAG